MSQQSFSIRFYLILERAKSNKLPIYCRIIIDRKKSEFFTQQYVTKSKWDAVRMRAKGSPETNAVLSGIEAKIRSIYNQSAIEGKPTTASEIKSKHLGCTYSNQSVLFKDKYFGHFHLIKDNLFCDTLS